MYPPRDLFYIVSSVKADLDLNNTKHDLKFLKWAIDGFRELNMMNILPTVKTVRLVIDPDTKSAVLPDDFPDQGALIKLGICCNGYFVNFDLNPLICLEERDPCCEDEIQSCLCNAGNLWTNSGLGMWEWWYSTYWHNNQPIGSIYGRGEGFYRGGYRIDEEKRRIVFDRYVVVDYAIMEYQSSGGIESGNAYIPEYAIRPLTNFVHRQRTTFSTDPMENKDKQLFGSRYAKGVKAAIARINSLSQFDILSIWRASVQQLPKR